MKKLSVWAKWHKWQSRLIIFVCYLLLNVSGILVGDLLNTFQITLGGIVIIISIAAFITGLFIYPDKKLKHCIPNFYFVQKRADAVLLVSTFLMVVICGNQLSQNKILIAQPLFASSLTTVNNSVSIVSERPKTQIKSLDRKAIKKNIKDNLKELRQQYKTASKGGRIGLIILASLIAAGLIALVAALSCELSCSGSEAAALMVLLFGTGLVIFLLVKVIKRINNGPKLKPANLDS